jgi:Kef-type K+ transport system membrane component KefB
MLDLPLLFAFAVYVGAFLRRFKLPLLVGFLLAGLLIGRLAYSQETYSLISRFAEVGAGFLMFSIGLGINFKQYHKIGLVVVWLALLQVFMFVALSFGLFAIFNYSLLSALVLAATVSFSSTVLVAAVLHDKGEIFSLHGRVLIGVLLIQDLLVIVLMFCLPFLASGSLDWPAFLRKLFLGILLVGLCLVLGNWFFRHIKYLFKKDPGSLYLLSVAWLMIVTYIFSWSAVGLPVEIAGLVAGLSLAEVFDREGIKYWFNSVKDFFIVFLFLYIGTRVDVSYALREWRLILVLLVIIMVVKAVIGFITAGLAGMPSKVIFQVGIGLANMSELGFVLLPLTINLGILDDRGLSIFSILILTSIIVSAIVMYRTGEMTDSFAYFFKLLENRAILPETSQAKILENKVVLLGCHRAGWSILKNWRLKKDSLFIFDYDLENVEKLRQQGYHALYCDVGDKRFLQEIGLVRARMILSTIPSYEDNWALVKFVVAEAKGKKRPYMIVMSKQWDEVANLYRAGADLVLNPYMSVADSFAEVAQTTRRGVLVRRLRLTQQRLMKWQGVD